MQRTLTTADHAPVAEPRLARMGSRTSGEGSSLTRRPRLPMAPKQTTTAATLLRHNLTSPEKKTLKRIEALRRALAAGVDDNGAPVSVDSVGARIHDHLKVDRGLAGNVVGDGFVILAGRLVDAQRLHTPAATLVGDYLRESGATERGNVTPERVKAALQVLNDALYDLDRAAAPIPSSVRELRLEKRDGGLQIAAVLRVGADDAVATAALERELRRANYADVVVRCVAPPPPATKATVKQVALR